jgi:hypothetical protein
VFVCVFCLFMFVMSAEALHINKQQWLPIYSLQPKYSCCEFCCE